MKFKILIIIINYLIVSATISQHSKIIGETFIGERFEIDSFQNKEYNLYYIDKFNKREFILTTYYHEIYSMYYSINESIVGRKEIAIIFKSAHAPIYYTAIRQLDKPNKMWPLKLTEGKWIVLEDNKMMDIDSYTQSKEIEEVRWKTRVMFEFIFKPYIQGGKKKITEPTTYFLNDGNLWIYPNCDSTKVLHVNSKHNLIKFKCE